MPSFVCLEGQWYFQPFEESPTKSQLAHTLEALLQRHPPQAILLLRRMTNAEVQLLMEHRQDCEAEILSILLAQEEAR